MRIALGADHAGFHLKDLIKERLGTLGHEAVDFGTKSESSVDYPDYAQQVGEAVTTGEADLGILCCGAGVGMSIAANKIEGVRAALCADTFTARMSREHNDANVLCLGERTTGQELAWDIVKTWLETEFSGQERHQKRVDKMSALERNGKRL